MYVRNTGSHLASGRGLVRNLSSFRRENTMSTIAFGDFDAAVASSRLRITRRGRTVVTFLIAAPLAIAAAAFGLGTTGAVAGTGSAPSASFHYLTVDPGESLWQLAETIAPTADPRDVVADILTLNNLSSGDVQPGQRLAIPTKYDN